MKMRLLCSVLIAALVILSGCGPEKKLNKTNICTPEVGEGDLVPATFESIYDLKAGVLKAKQGEFFDLYSLSYCFELASVPPGFVLEDIRVKSGYCVFTYVDKAQQSSSSAITDSQPFIDLEWLRDDEVGNFDNKVTSYFQDDSSEVHRCMDNKNYAYKKLPTGITVLWHEDGLVFHANVPLTFTEEDILKYCVAKKVVLKE
ncbi:MAG: hypothetical protein N2376_06130 [Clostridia bacterium]|nr:hypothetical protein [Clostridia bacterium]